MIEELRKLIQNTVKAQVRGEMVPGTIIETSPPSVQFSEELTLSEPFVIFWWTDNLSEEYKGKTAYFWRSMDGTRYVAQYFKPENTKEEEDDPSKEAIEWLIDNIDKLKEVVERDATDNV